MRVLRGNYEVLSDEHAHHGFVTAQNSNAVLKSFDLSKYFSAPENIAKLYLDYRLSMLEFYPQIPSVISLAIDQNILFVEEERISGRRLDDVLGAINVGDWLYLTRTLFQPIIREDGFDEVRHGKNVRRFPLRGRIDLKPENVIVSDQGCGETMIPIDFFPPLLVDNHTGRYIHARTREESENIAYKYGDLLIMLGRHYFSTLSLNPTLGELLVNPFLELCSEFDTTGRLSDEMRLKAISAKERCPTCPFCK